MQSGVLQPTRFSTCVEDILCDPAPTHPLTDDLVMKNRKLVCANPAPNVLGAGFLATREDDVTYCNRDNPTVRSANRDLQCPTRQNPPSPNRTRASRINSTPVRARTGQFPRLGQDTRNPPFCCAVCSKLFSSSAVFPNEPNKFFTINACRIFFLSQFPRNEPASDSGEDQGLRLMTRRERRRPSLPPPQSYPCIALVHDWYG